MSVRVCKLVQHHPFEDARIFKKEAKSLKKLGYDVTMVAPRRKGFLYHVDGTSITDRYLEPRFMHEGIRVVTYNDQRDSIERMVDRIISGDMTDLESNTLVQAGMQEEADVYHAHEFLSLYAGVCIKRALLAQGKQTKLIYDSHEYTPDPFSLIDPNKKNMLHKLLLLMLTEVDYVIAISDTMKSWYLTLNPFLRIEVLYNSPPLNIDYQPKTEANDTLTVCYEGNISSERGSIDNIIGITEACNREVDTRFKIIGGHRLGRPVEIPPHLEKKIIVTGWVPYERIFEHMTDVDIGWIANNLPYTLNHMFAMPNKFFSYLNNGVPVVVNKCHEMEDFIRRHHCGLVIDNRTPTVEDYADALIYLHKRRKLLQDMSANARLAMEQLYSWEHMEKRLGVVYKRVIDPGYLKYRI